MVKTKLVQIWPITKYLASFLRTYTLKTPFPGKHEQKKNNDAPNMAESTQGPQARYHAIYITHQFPNCFVVQERSHQYPQTPLLVSKEKQGRQEYKANGERQEGGLRVCVHMCMYIHIAEDRRQKLWMEQAWASRWLDRAGDRCPWCVLAPTNLGNSLTLDGSKARNDGGARRRTGAAVDETLPFIHGGGGLNRELVLEICLGKDRHVCALEFSITQFL